MSVEMLDRVYGHHHPERLRTAAHAINYRSHKSLDFIGVGRDKNSAEQQVPANIGGPAWTRTRNQTVMSESDNRESLDKSVASDDD
jgi:hypothetical protein